MAPRRRGLSSRESVAEEISQTRALRRAQHARDVSRAYAENPAYRALKQNANAIWMRSNRAKERDIGYFPMEIDWDRRLSCKNDLKLFDEVYLKGIFDMAWSSDQLICVDRT